MGDLCTLDGTGGDGQLDWSITYTLPGMWLHKGRLMASGAASTASARKRAMGMMFVSMTTAGGDGARVRQGGNNGPVGCWEHTVVVAGDGPMVWLGLACPSLHKRFGSDGVDMNCLRLGMFWPTDKSVGLEVAQIFGLGE